MLKIFITLLVAFFAQFSFAASGDALVVGGAGASGADTYISTKLTNAGYSVTLGWSE